MTIATPIRERLLNLVEVQEPTGCWIWQGTLNSSGYARIFTGPGKKLSLAHRVSYRIHKGEIPAGLTIDHLCRERTCVNPDHLEAVTSRVNTLRGNTLPGINAVKTHCPQDHEYSVENTRVRAGKRHCRTCDRDRAARNRLRAVAGPQRNHGGEGQ